MPTTLHLAAGPTVVAEPDPVVHAPGSASLMVTGHGPYDRDAAIRVVVAEAQELDPVPAFTVLPGTGFAPPWGAEDVLAVLVVDAPGRAASFARRLAGAFEQDAVLVRDLGGAESRHGPRRNAYRPRTP
jgi:hypothetical protein